MWYGYYYLLMCRPAETVYVVFGLLMAYSPAWMTAVMADLLLLAVAMINFDDGNSILLCHYC
jgi:uncharacterized membrane protein (DUF485 family)